MANQPPVTFDHHATLLGASGTQATGAETRVITTSLVGTNQGLDVVPHGTLPVSMSGGTDVNIITGTVDSIANLAGGTVGITNLNTLSTNNSTTSTLDAGGTWTAVADDVTNYSAINISLYASHVSATSGMKFQFSQDNVNWDDSYNFNAGAGTARRFQFPVTARYFRVQYINGAGSQTAFRVQTILHRHNQLTSIHRLVDDMSPDRSAQVFKGALFAAVNGTGDFQAIQANAAGILKIGGAVEIDGITADLPGGTIDLVSNLATGTIADATVTSLPQVSVGTIPQVSVGTVPNINIATGTQQTLGTVGTLAGLGTVTNIGSIGNIGVLHAGTVTTSLALNSGTITTIQAGTQNTLGTVGTVIGLGTLTNIGNLPQISVGTLPTVNLSDYGTVVDVNTLPDLPGGTLDAGTVVVTTLPDIPGGTIDLGTVQVNPIPVGSSILSIHARGTGGGTVVGTLVAPTGAGTTLYLAGLSIVAVSGTVDCGIANNVAGTTGAGVYARGQFVPSAGIMRDYSNAKNLGTNGTIAWFMISAGTVDFQVDYWVTP